MKKYLIEVFVLPGAYFYSDILSFFADKKDFIFVSANYISLTDISLVSFRFLSDRYTGLLSILSPFNVDSLFYVAYDIASGQRISNPILIHSENNL